MHINHITYYTYYVTLRSVNAEMFLETLRNVIVTLGNATLYVRGVIIPFGANVGAIFSFTENMITSGYDSTW